MKKANNGFARIRVAGLLILVLLLTAGCAEKNAEPTSAAAGTTQPPQTTEPVAATTAAPTTEPTTEPETEPTEPSVIITVEDLRQQMAGTNQRFAIAYFGNHGDDHGLPVDPYETMQAVAPELCRQMPFLLEIPKERVVGEYGELFCVIPLDPDASVTVYKMDGSGIHGDRMGSIYSSETGEPFLLFRETVYLDNLEMCISGPSGDVDFHPQTGAYGSVFALRNENGEDLLLDFSPYREILLTDYARMTNPQITSGYRFPTAEKLMSECWYGRGASAEDHGFWYFLTFYEDTLTVRWNDGSDKMDRVLSGVKWKLTYEDGYAVLTVDTGEPGGVRRYNVLEGRRWNKLYVAMDARQEELPIGQEVLRESFSSMSVQEPYNLIRKWKLVWTQVDGEQIRANPSRQSLYIRESASNEDGVYEVTYRNNDDPSQSFSERFQVVEEELYPGCGNPRWIAKMVDPGDREVEYTLTLVDWETLVMKTTWEENGETKVSYGWYRSS